MVVDLAARVHVDLLGQVAVGHRGRDLGDVTDLAGEVAGHAVDVVGQVLPHPGHAPDLRLAAQPAFGADLAGYPGHLVGERRQLVHHRVDGVFELQDLALGIHGDFLAQVPVGHRRRHMRDVPHLNRKVAGHPVHRIGEILPHPGHAPDLRLTAEVALGADLAGHPGHLVGERRQLVHHRVHGLLELQHLALGINGHLAGQVAAGYCSGDCRDIADLDRLVGDL